MMYTCPGCGSLTNSLELSDYSDIFLCGECCKKEEEGDSIVFVETLGLDSLQK